MARRGFGRARDLRVWPAEHLLRDRGAGPLGPLGPLSGAGIGAVVAIVVLQWLLITGAMAGLAQSGCGKPPRAAMMPSFADEGRRQMKVDASIVTSQPIEAVWAYMTDFANATVVNPALEAQA